MTWQARGLLFALAVAAGLAGCKADGKGRAGDPGGSAGTATGGADTPGRRPQPAGTATGASDESAQPGGTTTGASGGAAQAPGTATGACGGAAQAPGTATGASDVPARKSQAAAAADDRSRREGAGPGQPARDGERDAAGAAAAREEPPKVTDVTAQDYQPPPMPKAHVILEDAYGIKHVVEVEVAAEEWSRTRGMMWRTELKEGKGMLFLFPGSEWRSFWMKNTLIPLDILFIAADGTVVGIVREAQPLTRTSRSVNAPSKYVLELPGGWTEKFDVQPGSKAILKGLAGIPVR